MPGEASKSLLADTLKAMEEKAKALAQTPAAQADKLNKALDRVEQKLASSAMRMEWHHNTGTQPIVQVRFERNGSDWYLSVTIVEHGEEQGRIGTLSSMSLVQKAELAKVLPEFISSYLKEQSRRHALIRQANTAIDEVLRMLEGA